LNFETGEVRSESKTRQRNKARRRRCDSKTEKGTAEGMAPPWLAILDFDELLHYYMRSSRVHRGVDNQPKQTTRESSRIKLSILFGIFHVNHIKSCISFLFSYTKIQPLTAWYVKFPNILQIKLVRDTAFPSLHLHNARVPALGARKVRVEPVQRLQRGVLVAFHIPAEPVR